MFHATWPGLFGKLRLQLGGEEGLLREKFPHFNGFLSLGLAAGLGEQMY